MCIRDRPIPLPLVFALIFLAGTVVAGSNGIIAMCIPCLLYTSRCV